MILGSRVHWFHYVFHAEVSLDSRSSKCLRPYYLHTDPPSLHLISPLIYVYLGNTKNSIVATKKGRIFNFISKPCYSSAEWYANKPELKI